MKKIKIIACLILVLGMGISNFSYAQSRGGNGPVTPIRLGTVTLNLGVGVGAQYKGNYYNSPFGTKVAVEAALWQAGPGVITLGGEIGGSFSNGGNNNFSEYKASTIVVAIRSAWHYGWKVPGLDTYGGVSAGLGFHHHYYKDYNGNQNQVIPVPGIFVGASYFVSPKFGFNAEAGNDITAFQAGVIFKLK
ncbi:hypothetical protein BH11BAC3_BH11BAC3_44450 [soil metagenome]